MEIVRGILLNTAFLFAFLFILNMLVNTNKINPKWSKIIQGLVFGIVTVGLMMNAWELENGVIFDTRTVMISVVSLFFSVPTAIITSFIAIGYRLYVGGIGVYAGLASILSAFGIGIIWKHFIYRKLKMKLHWELYLFGIAVHILMLVSQLLMPSSVRAEVFRTVSIPIITIYPVIVMVVGLYITKSNKEILLQQELESSERRYRTIFYNNPLGLFQYDNNGVIQLCNDRFAEMLRTKKTNLIGLDMKTLPNRKLVNKLENSLSGVPATYEDYYESFFSHHRFYTRVQFSPLISDKEQIGGIGLVEDLSEQIESQKTIDELTKTDLLTKLLNRQSFDQFLFRRISQKILPITIVVGDINTFEIINETFGFEEGNQILIQLANIFSEVTNKNIKAYRTGGDEFALIMSKTDFETGKEMITTLKHKISNISVHNIDLSLSFGLATYDDMETGISETYNKAIIDLKSNKIYDGSGISKKTIDIIMTTLFEKSKRELKHSERVGKISGLIAKEFNLGTAFYNKTFLAGKLHDIGKINLDQAILDKPGKLNDEEWFKVKKHSESGFQILSSVPEYLEIAAIVLSHHERFDGKGYPNQIKGHDIPLPSRIITLADAYDAMTENRTYRDAMSKEEAIEEIKRCKGTQFDPVIVDIFLNKVIDKIK